MFPIVSWVTLSILSLPILHVAAADDVGCTSPTQVTPLRANALAHRLQEHYLDSDGQYSKTYDALWTGANIIEDIHNLMLVTGTHEFDNAAENSFVGKRALDPSTDWRSLFGSDNGGIGWFVLALSKIGDYQKARGRDNTVYINNAKAIYSILEAQWDDVCGGGVWWTIEKTYKNTNTNHLFLLVSADGFLRFREQKYLDNAQKAWKWLSSLELRNADGLWYDGLDSSNSTTDPKSCPAGDRATWTYNQGVIASGLAALSVATGDTSLLDQAEITLDATMKHLTANNILKEGCDEINSYCSTNPQIFKGVWTKHLRYYLNYANSTARTKKYSAFLQAQSAAVGRATTTEGDISSIWWEPGKNGSQYTPQSAAGGLAAHVAAGLESPTHCLNNTVPDSSSSTPSSSSKPDPSNLPDPQPNTSSRKIIGISVGVTGAFILLVLVAIFLYRKRSRNRIQAEALLAAHPADLPRTTETFGKPSQHVAAEAPPPPYTKSLV